MKIGISAIHLRHGKSGSHEPYLVNLVNAICVLDSPHEYTLFVTKCNQHLFKNVRARMEFVKYPKFTDSVLARILLEQFWLPIDACRRNVDVMHYPGSSGSFLVRKQDVVTVHQDPISHSESMSCIKNIYFQIVLRNFVRKAGRVITPSNFYSHQLIEFYGYKPEKVVSVHHGVNPIFRDVSRAKIEKVRRKFGIEPNAILTVSNTYPHKNIPNLIRAFHFLLERKIESQLVIVGDVNESTLDRIITQNTDNPAQFRKRIKVIQFLPHDDLPPIYAAASVFVFFSRVETFGMPLVEAMACGLPIIASDIPVHREILQNAGMLISPDAPDRLASALARMLTDKKFEEQKRILSHERSQEFSWRITAIQTIKAYEDAWNLEQ